MAKCPKCKKEIEALTNIQSGWNRYILHLVKSGKNCFPDYDFKEFETDNNVNEYYCPRCDELLFTNEDKAINFLKGRKKKNGRRKYKMQI